MYNSTKFENESVIGVPSTDNDGNIFTQTLVGSYVVIPKSLVGTPFDLSEQEWVDTKRMIDTIKHHLDNEMSPDGYNLGWNVGRVAGQTVSHAHLHIIPRFDDEPFAGKGIRHWLKKNENQRL
ncbi:MAG: HIT family protein [Defluviitaleaceae bacterium]|nr:HIT family protein [Defluviitaleaceae bacterium]